MPGDAEELGLGANKCQASADDLDGHFPRYSFEWSEQSLANCFEAGIRLAVGTPVEKVCADLGIPEREARLFDLVSRLETGHLVTVQLLTDLDIDRQKVPALRRDCVIMRAVLLLTKLRTGPLTALDKKHILRSAEPVSVSQMFGVKDAAYLQFQQEFFSFALVEKERLLNELKRQTNEPAMIARIDQQLKINAGQKSHFEHGRDALAKSIERAKPPSAEEFARCLANEAVPVSEQVKSAFVSLIEELEEATLTPKARGFGSNIDLSEVLHIKRINAMPLDCQAEALVLAAALLKGKSEGHSRSKFSEGMRQLVLKLYKKPLPLTAVQLCSFLRSAGELHRTGCALPSSSVLSVIERFAGEGALPSTISGAVENYRIAILGSRSPGVEDKTTSHRLQLLLARTDERQSTRLPIEPNEAWSDRAIADLKSMENSTRQGWLKLIDHCAQGKSTKPSAAWAKQADNLIGAIGEEKFVDRIEEWFGLIPKRGTIRDYDGRWNPDPSEQFCPQNVDILKGLAWCCAHRSETRLVNALGDAAEACFKKVKNLGPRCPRLGNACLYALSEINTKEAVAQLSRVQGKAKHASAKAQVEKALSHAADQSGLSVEDLQDLSTPDFGMTEVGRLIKRFGEWHAEVILNASEIAVTWISPAGKKQQSIPAQVKSENAAALKEFKKLLGEMEKLLPSVRSRIEHSLIEQRHWRFDSWKERYLDHPVCGTIARRLLWNFNGRTGIWHGGTFVADDGVSFAPEPLALVELWHPIGAAPNTVLHWRRWLAEHQIVQPFKQCHREIYVLTDAERGTETYSNRFANHIVRQHQLHRLCLERGWQYHLMGAFDSHSTPTLKLPHWNLVAEFWVDNLDDAEASPMGIYTAVATEQVKFLRPVPGKASPLVEQMRGAMGGRSIPAQWLRQMDKVQYEPVPLTEIMPVVFSEVMRDIDLFVSASSIGIEPERAEGRHAHYWQQYAFGQLNDTAKTRKHVLEELIPQLHIASRCRIDDNYLVVRGDLSTYKIHLGSGNILMEPNDQYLCIVQSRGMTTGRDRLFLPFEGDAMLSVILSKAVLLAEDSKITDASILRQIKRQ